MGCIGMSMDDFCRCTPSEFYEVWRAYRDHEQRQERGFWERIRMECLCTLQPHSKKKLTTRDIMTFPWEKEVEVETQKETLTEKELCERVEWAKNRYGLK